MKITDENDIDSRMKNGGVTANPPVAIRPASTYTPARRRG